MNPFRLAAIGSIPLLLAISVPLRADVVNGSFENGSFSFDGNGADSLQPGSTVITGWNTFGGELAVIENTNSFGLATPYGSTFLDLTGYHDSSPYGGVQQSIATLIGQYYDFSVYLGVNNNQGLEAFGPVSVLVTAGSYQTTLTANPTGSGNIWTKEDFFFPATSTTTEVSIQGSSTASGHFIGLDNISVDTANIPEPGSLLMLSAGALAMLGYARRR